MYLHVGLKQTQKKFEVMKTGLDTTIATLPVDFNWKDDKNASVK